jgi:hypothetical protein
MAQHLVLLNFFYSYLRMHLLIITFFLFTRAICKQRIWNQHSLIFGRTTFPASTRPCAFINNFQKSTTKRTRLKVTFCLTFLWAYSKLVLLLKGDSIILFYRDLIVGVLNTLVFSHLQYSDSAYQNVGFVEKSFRCELFLFG